MTPEQELEQLRSEVAALRAQTRTLHPDIQPRFYHGSAVKYGGELYRVIGISIDWDSVITYALAPSQFKTIPHVTTVAGGLPIYDTVDVLDEPGSRDGETIYEIAEADLEPVDAEQLSRGAEQPGSTHSQAKITESATM